LAKDGRTYCADEQHPSRRAEDGAHLTVVLVAPHKAAQPDHGFTFQTANTPPHSRDSIRPSFANSSAPKRKRAHATLKRGRGEDRVRAAPAVSCAKVDKKTHMSIQVQRKHSGLPRAMVLQLISCSPRRDQSLFVTVAPKKREPLGNLTPAIGASGPHDFAVRLRHARQSQHSRPPLPAPTSVTMANAPSLGTGWGD
jgi:hypothetical protein